MPTHDIINKLNNKDIAIINSAVAQVCAAILIKVDSVEGQALAGTAVRKYMSGNFNQRDLINHMLISINRADRVQRRAERIAEAR